MAAQVGVFCPMRELCVMSLTMNRVMQIGDYANVIITDLHDTFTDGVALNALVHV